MIDKVVAVTGGIGSGKSVVIDIIKELGYAVLSADEEYSLLLQNRNFVEKIHKIAGVNGGETLDRKAVASAVFSDPLKLKKLNEYTHKKVYEQLFLKSKNKGLVFHEVPLLFESGYQDSYDKVIVITRNLSDRINSVMKRSNLTKEEVLKRIENQYNYENLDKNKHTVISNDGTILDLTATIKAVIDEI